MVYYILVITLVLIFFIIFWLDISFKRWEKKLIHSLEANSKVMKTEKGIVEYRIDGDGPAILAFHGTPGGYDQSYHVLKELVDEGFKLVSISRPGYLKTPLNSGKTFEEGADLAAALLDSLNIKKVSVIGASGGGPISLLFAIKYPERINALIMECAISHNFEVQKEVEKTLMGRLFSSDKMMGIGLWFIEVLTRLMPLQSYKLILKAESLFSSDEIKNEAKFLKNNSEQMDFYRKFIKTTAPFSIRTEGYYNDLLQFNNVDRIPLEQITCPTLVIHGDKDKDAPISHAENTVKKINGAEFYKLHNVGHIIWIGHQRYQLHQKVVDFLSKNNPIS